MSVCLYCVPNWNTIEILLWVCATNACLATENGSLVIILIKTAARDQENRKVLRNSWILDVQQSGLSYAFLIGQ